VVYIDKKAVGCGAIRKYAQDTIEIKRMFVSENARGKGIGTRILTELEIWATELGFEKSILETGNMLPEAVRLYKKNNYIQIPNYGQYEGMEKSICFAKKL
jgi:GNAT superfamily N-acetyltransferase